MIDKAALVNMALSEIGHVTSFSANANPDLADAVEQSWQRAIDHCVSLHDWKDFRRTRKLNTLTTAPENGWPYAHELPGDRIGEPLKILTDPMRADRPLRNFDREGNLVLSHHPELWARIKVMLDPASWDAGWRSAFVIALAGYLAVPVLHAADLKKEKHNEAFGTLSKEGSGGLFGRLIAQDRASAPVGAPISEADPLTRAHGGHNRLSGPWYGDC